jgi:hypothetical protein
VGASFQRLVSELNMGDDVVNIRMDSVAAGLEWRPGGRFSLQIGAGAIVDGSLRARRVTADVKPGWIASVSGGWTAIPERPSTPFLSLNVAFGISGARTARQGEGAAAFLAMDARLAVVVGKTLWEFWVPYLVARAFGGPVWWEIAGEDVTGGDRHHYQLGIGSLAACPLGFDVLMEWVPFGARGLTAGIGMAL